MSMLRTTHSPQGLKARWTAIGAGLLLLVIVSTGLYLGDQTRLCCANPVRDSSRESSMVAEVHEQTDTTDL
jgi:hypothetical protein